MPDFWLIDFENFFFLDDDDDNDDDVVVVMYVQVYRSEFPAFGIFVCCFAAAAAAAALSASNVTSTSGIAFRTHVHQESQ